MSDNLNPGIFFVLGFNGLIPQKDFLDLIAEFPPAGYLLLERNFSNPEQLAKLTSILKSATGHNCFIAVDQEPGRVQRFRVGFPESKAPADYLKNNSMDDFRDWCGKTAGMLRQVGIDMNLAPVVDLMPPDAGYPVLQGRSFGDDPDIVSRFAGVLIEEHRRNSIFTCAKHFPGLGSGVNDPHRTMAVSTEPVERFRNHHWNPFRRAVEYGVDAIMTTHLLAPSLDDKNCATYSETIVGSLRGAAGHAGAVISDDLCMAGAGDRQRIGVAATNAIDSGHNLVIISKDVRLQRQALREVSQALGRSDTLRRAAIENAEIVEKFSHPNQ